MFNVSLFFFQVQEFFGGPKKVFLIQIYEYPSLTRLGLQCQTPALSWTISFG